MTPTPVSLVSIALGAVFGAWLRWGLGLWLNTQAARLPWGTLAANLVGGYLIGLVLGLLAANPGWPEWLRLALVTGFLGALTTFSTFSAETVALVQTGRPLAALGYAGISLLGSFALTATGLLTVHFLSR
jgi:CrcB protein